MTTPQLVKKLPKYRAIYQCLECSSEYEGNRYGVMKRRLPHLCDACSNPLSNIDDITQENLNALMRYDEETGEVSILRNTARQNAGDILGYVNTLGYKCISLNRKDYLLHRVIWFMKTGNWPEQVDHINHDKTNNSWKNLREVKSQENQMNLPCKKSNTSGVTGVRVLPSGRFCAYIMVHRKQISLGTYDDFDDAVQARKAGEQKYGFHINHGQ